MCRQLFRAMLLPGVLVGLAAEPARGQDAPLQREINQAIDRGVAYLRKIQEKDGIWPNNYAAGATALAAWTLLESGVPADDPAVQKAAWVLREKCPSLTHNYSVCLAVMFFDRLGNPADEPLIESLALRIMASQGKTCGGWYYDLVPTPQSEVTRLEQHYQQVKENKAELRKMARKPGDVSQLAPEIRQQLAGLVLTYDAYDNSNTQFALLALWVARRHGMPVGPSLAMVERHFRATQSPTTGCWKYQYGPEGVESELKLHIGSVTAMTSAGLLALAVGHEAVGELSNRKKPRPEFTRDPQVKLGLSAMAALIGNVQQDRSKVPIIAPGNERDPGKQQGYYTLWSLERMAVVYGLKTIGTKDWYSWGAQILVVNQQPDGSWHGDFSGSVDTCFALLFLKRANVAQDLTDKLKGRVTDPGKVHPRMQTLISKQDSAAPGNPESKKQEAPAKGEAAVPSGEGVPAEAGRLSKELVAAAPAEQNLLLEKLRDTPGPTYTQALADAIPKLRGTAKTRARQALAKRFEKLDTDVLRLHLKAAEPEMRRAAATATGAKKVRELIPDLINLLEDREATVVQAAHAALRQATEQDFGPELDATPAERAAAIEAWRKWWKQQS
jgi:hypothetical protein